MGFVVGAAIVGLGLWSLLAPRRTLGRQRWHWKDGDDLEVSDAYAFVVRALGVALIGFGVFVGFAMAGQDRQKDRGDALKETWGLTYGFTEELDRLLDVPTLSVRPGTGTAPSDPLATAEILGFAVVGSTTHAPEVEVPAAHDGDLVLKIDRGMCEAFAAEVDEDADEVRLVVLTEPGDDQDPVSIVTGEPFACDQSDSWRPMHDELLVHVPLAEPLGDRAVVDGLTGDPVPSVPLS
ncbi:hypothetical protein CLV28_2988 [Sediminihabitans luteus]|uniref:DUF6199 domain-containing protein n=1 Tax=Sediminihabitans luteus TaxID=1138585 RepID=A0A2M9CBV8_9CELL|nr:hypothetical protein [Sediminihabitans luteus]PJJ68572.1 hypothetical protein CLV28_2988 [Sediminihabitans luteus]GII99910.1 hypothetical protein Slu03_22880 [Sediminihabitans luteus]